MNDNTYCSTMFTDARRDAKLRYTLIALVVAFAAWMLWPLAIVPAGQRGVLTTLGKPSDEVLGEGLHLRLPVLQKIWLMDVRVARNEGQGEAASSDLQAVQAKVIVNYHLDPDATVRAFRDIAPSTAEVAARIIDPARPRGRESGDGALHRRGADHPAHRGARADRRPAAREVDAPRPGAR